MSNVQLTKEKLAGTKVKSLGSLSLYEVDKSENEPLYDAINDGDLLIPSGYVIALIDGATTVTKAGNGKYWDDAITLGGDGGSVTPETVGDALADKEDIADLVSPTSDYGDLTAVTAAVKSIIDALQSKSA